MTLLLRWIRITLMILAGVLMGAVIACHVMPDNRLAIWLRGDPDAAIRVSFEGGKLSNYARCHAAKCYYS